jgi:hypothetical protein
LIPTSVALRAKKDRPLVVINTMDLPAKGGEMDADFRANQAGGAGDEEFQKR